jgi:hypothetical protein
MYSAKMHIPAHPNDALSVGIKFISILNRVSLTVTDLCTSGKRIMVPS